MCSRSWSCISKRKVLRKMLPNYQLKITDFYNIPINNVKKSAPAFFDQEKYVIHYVNLQPYLRLGLKLKANNAF